MPCLYREKFARRPEARPPPEPTGASHVFLQLFINHTLDRGQLSKQCLSGDRQWRISSQIFLAKYALFHTLQSAHIYWKSYWTRQSLFLSAEKRRQIFQLPLISGDTFEPHMARSRRQHMELFSFALFQSRAASRLCTHRETFFKNSKFRITGKTMGLVGVRMSLSQTLSHFDLSFSLFMPSHCADLSVTTYFQLETECS